MYYKHFVLVVAFFVAVFLFSGSAKAGTHVTLKPTADATINSAYPNTPDPSGDLSIINSFSPDVTMKTLIKFDISQIPAGSTIDLAYLNLMISGCSPYASTPSLYAKRLISIWNESTVTWSTNIHTTDVGMVGARRNYCQNGSLISFDATAITQAWVNGSTNYGFLLYGSESEVFSQNLISRDDPTNYPHFEITYTPPASSDPASSSSSNSTSSSTNSGTSNGSSSNNPGSSDTADTAWSDVANGQDDSSATGESAESSKSDSDGQPSSLLDAISHPSKIFNWPWWKIAITVAIPLIIIIGIVLAIIIVTKRRRSKTNGAAGSEQKTAT